MNKELLQLQPSSVWKHFVSLLNTPRPSKKEQQAVRLVKEFGESLGLETIVDDFDNVIIRKKATQGMENRKGVVLQAHLDMVPQKNAGTQHDFEKDPIKAIIDGNWVTADNTTLGADDGMGVAAAMAVLEDNSLVHGPIECLFTTDEETGMGGARGLKYGLLRGDILFNLDAEDEGEIFIGCAGGINTNISLTYEKEPVPETGFSAFKVEIAGLKGGHSGLDIHLERGNANLIMNRLLINANEHLGVLVSKFNGGSLRNAIPREATAVVLVPETEIEAFKQYTREIQEMYTGKLATDDPGLEITVKNTEMPEFMIDVDTLDDLLNAINEAPNGVISMIKEMPGTVETSSNLGVIKTRDEYIQISTLQRSSSDMAKIDLSDKLRVVFGKTGASIEISGGYPGWKPNEESEILEIMSNTYKENFNKIPEIKVMHAGLECAILGDMYDSWDMISFGPTIRFPHSPDEKVDIESVGKFWQLLVKALEKIPVKG